MFNSTLTTDNFLVVYPDLLSTDQLQEILNIGKNTVYNLLKKGSIKSIKVGRNYKIPKPYIFDFIQAVSDIGVNKEVSPND